MSHINKVFNEKFENLDHYKNENNFKRCLSKLNLDNVRLAIERSKTIMEIKVANGECEEQYKGFKYYKENPSLSIWKCVEEILYECDLI